MDLGERRLVPAQFNDLVSIEASPLGRALDVVKTMTGVRDAAVFGNALHIVVPDAEATMRDLQTVMDRDGVKVRRMARIRPSLEDAFVALTKGDSSSPGALQPGAEASP